MASVTKTRRTKKVPVALVPEVEPVVEHEAETPAEVVEMPKRVALTDLWTMRLAQLEKRAALAEAETARVSKLYVLQAIDPKGRVLALEKKQATAQHQAEQAENRALLARKTIEGKLGRKLEGLSIDPETGEVVQP